MARYSEEYWSDYRPFGLEEGWGCKITDSETGLVGETHDWRSSKTKAHDDAWNDLQNKLERYNSTKRFFKNEGGYENPNTGRVHTSTGDETAWGCIIVFIVIIVLMGISCDFSRWIGHCMNWCGCR